MFKHLFSLILLYTTFYGTASNLSKLTIPIKTFSKNIPQEKVYLHLDNTCYFIGDTIWYKGYVTRSDRRSLTDLSKILYVELLTPDGFLVERQQLEMPDGTAHGAFVLKDSLYAGYCELRAYTRWMLNFGQYEHPHSEWVENAFYNTQMAKDFFRDYDKLYSRVFPVYDRPEEEGRFVKDMTVRPLRRYFKSRKEKPQPDLHFYPEGGNLVEGTDCRVALELNDEDGMHLENMDIAIVSRNGKDTVHCRTDERGRAVFTLPDVSGEADYRAVFSFQGYDFKEKLPKVEENGCALTVIQNDNVVVATLQVQNVSQPLALHVMCQGVSHYYQPLDNTAPPERGAGPKGLRGLTTTKETPTKETPTKETPTKETPTKETPTKETPTKETPTKDTLVDAKPLSRSATAPLPGGAVATATDNLHIIQVAVPLDSLPTGVNQLTVFDGEGRIYADRLFFVNHHDYDTPRLAVSGIRQQYEPFDSITLHLRLTHPEDSAAGLSLSVRDRATEEPTYDNGTMLTEMLLASEIRGFVENPGYYFEADDSQRRQALDRLLMVQGWRRYDWKEIVGVKPFKMQFIPEAFQTLQGSVHPTYPLYEDSNPDEKVWIHAINPSSPIFFYTTAQENTSTHFFTLQELYAPYINKLKKEVHVISSFAQGKQVKELMQKTENGTFYMQTPPLYDNYTLTLTASDAEDPVADVSKKQKKGYADEEEYPDYYVKRDLFYPFFPKPYNFYQTTMPSMASPNDSVSRQSFTDRFLPTVTVRNKRNGLRTVNLDQPALVIDAYQAFNLATDYGLNGGKHDWRTFAAQIAIATVGDMGLERHYTIQEWYDGKPLIPKINRTFDREQKDSHAPKFSFPVSGLKKYRYLRNLDRLYIYTDYAPREEGSWRYSQDNQPEVIIDYRRFPDEGYQHTFRDRHYVLRGYAVCEDFYSPDYSRRPLPDVKDYRRTLLWMPEVRFDRNGEATVRLYNNGKPTSLSVEAEGITVGGKFIQYKNVQP